MLPIVSLQEQEAPPKFRGSAQSQDSAGGGHLRARERVVTGKQSHQPFDLGPPDLAARAVSSKALLSKLPLRGAL